MLVAYIKDFHKSLFYQQNINNEDSTMSIESGRDALVAIDGNLSAEIKAKRATRTIVKSLTGSSIFAGFPDLTRLCFTNLKDVLI